MIIKPLFKQVSFFYSLLIFYLIHEFINLCVYLYVCGELCKCVSVWCICLECTCLKIYVWVCTLFLGSRDQGHVTCSSTPSTFPRRQAGHLMKPEDGLVTSKPCGLLLYPPEHFFTSGCCSARIYRRVRSLEHGP